MTRNLGCSTRWWMFPGRPVMKLSTQTTAWPSARNRSQRWDPMNPAPPVISVRTPPSPAPAPPGCSASGIGTGVVPRSWGRTSGLSKPEQTRGPSPRSIPERQADQFLVVADVDSPAGNGRVGPGRPAGPRLRQLLVFLDVGGQEPQVSLVVVHEHVVVGQPQEGGVVLAHLGLVPHLLAGRHFHTPERDRRVG